MVRSPPDGEEGTVRKVMKCMGGFPGRIRVA
jgi:hypothetical protein